MTRLRPAAVALMVSLAVLVVALLAFAFARPEPNVGIAPSSDPTPSPTDLAAPSPEPTPSPSPSPSSPPVPEIGRRSAAIADLATEARRAPTRLTVDALGIDVPITGVGVEPGSGAMIVPEDPAVAGWYEYGVSPGADGSAVITAHIDSRRYGVGPFERLRQSEPGTQVIVTYDDGSSATFEITGRRQYDKQELPVDELFRRDGEPTLALVTCGGAFDPTIRRYEDNVVVYAVPT